MAPRVCYRFSTQILLGPSNSLRPSVSGIKFPAGTRRQMSWNHSSQGGWERPLDPMESWVHTNAQATTITQGVQDNTINIFARIRVDLGPYGGVNGFTERLKGKWYSLCRQQPLLASVVTPEVTRYVPDFSTDLPSAKKWLAKSFRVIDDDHIDGAHDAYGTLPSVDQSTLYYFPRTQDILIRTPHYLVDGIGHLMLIERLLQMISLGDSSSFQGATWDHDSRNTGSALLSPTFAEALNLPKPNDAAINDVENFIQSFQKGQFPPTGLQFRSSATATQCRKLLQRFSVARSRAILKACKAKGVTITHAFHAAAMIVSQRLSSTCGATGLYSTGTAFDLRGKCKPPYSGNEHACTVYLLPRFVILQQDDFENTLGQLKSFYRNEWARPDLLPSIVPFLQQMDQLSHKFAAAPPTSSIGMSSFGDLRRWMSSSHGTEPGRIQVQEISITGEFVTPSIALHLWSWNDKISMQMEWNDKYYTAEDIMEYQGAIFRELESRFELSLDGVLETEDETLKLT